MRGGLREKRNCLRETENDPEACKNLRAELSIQAFSGTEASRLDQAHLIATGGELTTLIALDDHATPGLDADHPGTHPTKGG